MAVGIAPYGAESAVVYEDELPWNKDKGVCFEITEERQYSVATQAMYYVWGVRFGQDTIISTAMIDDRAPERVIDTHRAQARAAILRNAHDKGIL